MQADITIPEDLKKLQLQMGHAITTPFEFHEKTGEHIFHPENYDPELLFRMNDQKGISASDRLLNYNRGYWYRLITLLQGDMPLMVHLLGYNEFNEFAMNYLSQYPSQSQILNYLGDSLTEFMKAEHKWQTALLKEVVTLEYCYIKAFDARQLKPLDPQKLTPQEIETLAEQVFYLQPHTFLFEENWDLVENRRIAEDTTDDDLILKPRKVFNRWIIYRSLGNRINAEKLDEHQWVLLQKISSGLSFNDAIESAFENYTDENLELVAPQIQNWFSQWVSWGVFSLES